MKPRCVSAHKQASKALHWHIWVQPQQDGWSSFPQGSAHPHFLEYHLLEVTSYQKVLSARSNSSSSQNPSGLFEFHFIMISGLNTAVLLSIPEGTRTKKKKKSKLKMNLFYCLCESNSDTTDSCLRAPVHRFLITYEVRYHRNTEIPAHNHNNFWSI